MKNFASILLFIYFSTIEYFSKSVKVNIHERLNYLNVTKVTKKWTFSYCRQFTRLSTRRYLLTLLHICMLVCRYVCNVI